MMTGDDTSRGAKRETFHDQSHLNEETYRSILFEAPDGFVMVDAEGRCQYLNPAFTRITGYTLEDLPTTSAWLERAHPNPAYRQRVQEMWEELLQGSRNSLVTSVVCGDGKVRDIEIRRSSLSSGCNLLTVRDVTEQVRIEERLRQITSELTAVVEAFPDLFLRLNIDGTIIDTRIGRLAKTSLVPRTLLGRRIQDIFPAEIGDALLDAVQQAAQTGAPATSLEFCHTENGEVRYYEARVVPLHDTHLMAIIREITERKQTEQVLQSHHKHLEELVAERTAELERTNEQLKQLLHSIEMSERRAAEEWLDSSINLIADDAEVRITTDASGVVVIADEAAGDLIGYGSEELTGREIWSLFSGDNIREVLSSEVLGQGRPAECTEGTLLVGNEGLSQWVRISAAPITDVTGGVIGMVCTLRKA